MSLVRHYSLLTLLSICFLVFTGCATVRKEKTWQGHHFFYISCSGLTSSWSQCFRQAQQSCGDLGYGVAARSHQLEDDSEGFLFGINPAGYTSRDLIIYCHVDKNEAGEGLLKGHSWKKLHRLMDK